MLSDLIMLPGVAATVLTLLCAVTALASPRVFLNPGRRLAAALLFAVYFATLLGQASFLSDDVLVDWKMFLSWCAMVIPPAMCFWLMKKLEDVREDRPMKFDRPIDMLKAS